MAELTYTAIASLDGYVADSDGRFDWSAPDEEVHSFVNDLERPVGTYLYGRRMYEVMLPWETLDPATASPTTKEYAEIWRAADKVVYSRTLEGVSSRRTRLEPTFDPEAARHLKATALSNLSIGGSTLAAEALRANLVDEIRLFLNPVVVGGGLPALPTESRLDLELVEQRRFTAGVVFLRYRMADRTNRA